MSVRQFLKIALFWVTVGAGNQALAADEVPPDLEFLEYLGSWEESDEDWLLFAEAAAEKVAEDSNKHDEKEQVDKKSTESEDES